MNTTAKFTVTGHTKNAIKCQEVDSKGAHVDIVIGALYLKKTTFGDLPVGSFFTVTVEVPE